MAPVPGGVAMAQMVSDKLGIIEQR
jgi:hypothetical protein